MSDDQRARMLEISTGLRASIREIMLAHNPSGACVASIDASAYGVTIDPILADFGSDVVAFLDEINRIR